MDSQLLQGQALVQVEEPAWSAGQDNLTQPDQSAVRDSSELPCSLQLLVPEPLVELDTAAAIKKGQRMCSLQLDYSLELFATADELLLFERCSERMFAELPQPEVPLQGLR